MEVVILIAQILLLILLLMGSLALHGQATGRVILVDD
jgi:hypothetical protein